MVDVTHSSLFYIPAFTQQVYNKAATHRWFPHLRRFARSRHILYSEGSQNQQHEGSQALGAESQGCELQRCEIRTMSRYFGTIVTIGETYDYFSMLLLDGGARSGRLSTNGNCKRRSNWSSYDFS